MYNHYVQHHPHKINDKQNKNMLDINYGGLFCMKLTHYRECIVYVYTSSWLNLFPVYQVACNFSHSQNSICCCDPNRTY